MILSLSATGPAFDCSLELKRLAAVILSLAFAAPLAAQVTLTQGTNFSIDTAADGRIIIDLLGTVWIVPAGGGAATAVAIGDMPARRPQWSPSADSILYQTNSAGQDQLWEYRLGDDAASKLSNGVYSDQHASYHPGGERIVFSSARFDTGFDLWELDLATRLTWRLSHVDGDELEPAWSGDGRDLVYVHHHNGTWSIMLRRLGEPDHELLTSPVRLSAPQWRPDGTLITFLRHDEESLSVDMIILSDPLLIRTLLSGEDFFGSPVTWIDRQQFLYPADGVIRKRNFNSWSSSTVPFRAAVNTTQTPVAAKPLQRDLPVLAAPAGQLVLRTARLFDGIGGGYKQNIDVVIAEGRIAALEPRRERPGEIIVDLGDLTTLPGFVDSYANLPNDGDDSIGSLLLSLGVTTVVSNHTAADRLNQTWSGKEMPGPRVLSASNINAAKTGDPTPWLVTVDGDLAAGIAHREIVSHWMSSGVPVLAENWQVALGSGATLLLGANSLPTSPGGRRYADISLANGTSPVTIISGIADAGTPGIERLLQSRQAALLPAVSALRRFTQRPDVSANATSVVLGSKPNGLPPGIALHAEFLALAAAGLSGEQVLRAAGVNAAMALGIGLQLGRLAPGSVADMVIVDGDPLANALDLSKVVGVVRNGRFFSAIGLIERVQTVHSVE